MFHFGFNAWFGFRKKPDRKQRLNPAVTVSNGRFTMATLPNVQLFDSEKAPLNVAPVKPNGEPDTDVVVSVTSSDPSQVGVEQVDARNWFLTTPLESGVAIITLDAPGYEADTFELTYTPGQPRRLNVTVGAPVSDVE